jgi:alpha/beta superfamily hydrolase
MASRGSRVPRRGPGRYCAAVKRSLLVLLALAAALPTVWLLAGKLHRFSYWISRCRPADLQPLATSGWELVRLPVAADVELFGLVRPPREPNARWLLFAPGNGEALLRGFRGVLDALRGERDLGLCLFAYRGFDASGGTPDPAALRADLLRQWHWLRGRGVPAASIEVWGYSLGSVLASQLVADVVATGEQPARLVLVAAAERIAVRAHGVAGRFTGADQYVASNACGSTPILLLHGTADDALPLAGARALAAAFGSRATLHELPGRNHFDLWSDVAALAFSAR